MRVILISGEPAFRCGFRAVVATAKDLELVADACDARAGFRDIDAQAPDVVVMDVALEGMSGASATREIKRRAPQVRVLLLGSSPRERDVLEGFAAGAAGYALKTEPIERLLEAVRCVGHGERYLTHEVKGLSAEPDRALRRAVASGRADVLAVLSVREREVLDLVIRGWRNRDMARELCVSIKTIDTHRTRINRKLHCRSAVELIRFAADNGLLASPAPAREPRTIVMLMDDDPAARAALLRDLAPGYLPGRVSSAALALAQLRDGGGPAVFVIDPEPAHARLGGVRAVVALPESEVSQRLLAALEGTPALLPAPQASVGRVPVA